MENITSNFGVVALDILEAARTFTAIAEHKSLTQAAKKLGLSLPSVVRHLAEIERQHGVRLFQRTTRRLQITDDGISYLQFCERLRHEVDSISDVLAGKASRPKGEVSISAPVLFGQKHVAPAVIATLKQHQELSIRLRLEDALSDLVRDQVDVAVRIGTLPDSSMIARKVGFVRLVVCASPALLKITGKPRRPSDLANLPCLRFDGHRFNTAWTFQSGRRRIDVGVSGPFITNLGQPIIDACVSGLGFGQFISYQVAEEVERGQLEHVLEDYEPRPIPVHIVYLPGGPLPMRVRTVIDHLTAHLQRSLGENVK
jgi:DNA-binding transcriptional LysR family regulator